MLPKMGKVLPGSSGKGNFGLDYAGVIATALRSELGDTHRAIKIVMRWTGASERTVKNWLTGTSGPAGEHLVSLARYSNSVLEVFLQLAGRDTAILGLKLNDVRDKVAELQRCLDKPVGDAISGVGG
jgi:hypothetical protein